MVAYAWAPTRWWRPSRPRAWRRPPAKSGESSGRTAQVLQYVLRYTGKLFEPEQYRNIVIRANPDGSVLRLKDVADVEVRRADLPA